MDYNITYLAKKTTFEIYIKKKKKNRRLTYQYTIVKLL